MVSASPGQAPQSLKLQEESLKLPIRTWRDSAPGPRIGTCRVKGEGAAGMEIPPLPLSSDSTQRKRSLSPGASPIKARPQLSNKPVNQPVAGLPSLSPWVINDSPLCHKVNNGIVLPRVMREIKPSLSWPKQIAGTVAGH